MDLNRISLRALLFLCLALHFAGPVPGAIEPLVEELAVEERSERHSVLMDHGINTTPASLMEFLERGFSDRMIQVGLPGEPGVKTNVAIYAIQELGYQQRASAAPLLARIAEGGFPAGIESLLRLDLEPVPIPERRAREQAYREYVRYNAIVSLGLIGDPATAASVRQAAQEVGTAPFLAEAAIALGLMRDPQALDFLVGFLGEETREGADRLYRAVFVLTGNNYAITEVSSLARRREAFAELLNWKAQQDSAVPTRSEILRRRLTEPFDQRPPETSLRGALRAAAQFDDYDRRWAARERLREMAPTAEMELRRIVEDPYEDLDIRMTAMDWYAAVAPREARDVLRDLEKDDENPAIRQRAGMLRDDVRDYLRQQD